MNDKILFVDDEPNVLSSIERSLRKDYVLETALGGRAALELLEQNGPYAVIVSDMQMPEMNGAELLSATKALAPETVRIMLTGNADQQTAIDAINHGDILRFLNKPASTEQLSRALDAGLEQHKLITTERELLQNTLRGSVNALVETLALSNPDVFGRSMRLKNRMTQMVTELKLDNTWHWETIVLLSQIGCVSVPSDLVKRKVKGAILQPAEQIQFSSHAEAGAQLIGKIPRLEQVAESIRYQEKYYDGTGVPLDDIAGDAIPLGARLMRIIQDFDAFEMSGTTALDSLDHLIKSRHLYDPALLTGLKNILSQGSQRVMMSVSIEELTDDMELAADIHNFTGSLLVSKGQRTTESVRRHLRNHLENSMIEPIVEIWPTDE